MRENMTYRSSGLRMTICNELFAKEKRMLLLGEYLSFPYGLDSLKLVVGRKVQTVLLQLLL